MKMLFAMNRETLVSNESTEESLFLERSSTLDQYNEYLAKLC